MRINHLKGINWSKTIVKCYPYVVILLTIYLMIRYQILNRAVLLTSDAFLHFQRFYDTSMQIKTGNYSYFQTNFGFNHSGRIFNAMYGPFFAYLNGFILLLVHTWFKFQILNIVLVLFVAGVGMYQLAIKAKVNQIVAVLLTLIYLQFGITIGILRFNFMSWGAALAPYAMIQVLYMINDKKLPIHWLSLAIIMSLLSQIHVLSTLFIAATYIPFAIYGFIHTDEKKQMVIELLKAIGLTLLLTANIWGAMLLSFSGEKIALPTSYILSHHTVTISRYINVHGFLLSSIVFLLVIQLIYVICNFRKSTLNTFITIVGIVIVLLSSKLMPWDHLQAIFPMMGRYLQFPYRLTIGAWPLLLLGVGLSATELIDHYSKVAYSIIIFGLILVLLQNFSTNFATNRFRTEEFLNPRRVIIIQSYSHADKDRLKFQRILRTTNNGELFKYISHAEPDYLPHIKGNTKKLYQKNILRKHKKYHFQVQNDKLLLSWMSKNAHKQYLPIVMYHQSRLELNGRQLNRIKKNGIGQPLVKNRLGKNKAALSFIIPVWFKILLGLTLISWLILFIYGISRMVDQLKNRFREVG